MQAIGLFPLMKLIAIILFSFFAVCDLSVCLAQSKKIKIRKMPSRPDSVLVPASQAVLFATPQKNLLITHIDLSIGAGRVVKNDQSDLSFAGTVKGLYALTGALYVNMGLGVTSLSSIMYADSNLYPGRNKATIISMPVGFGFTMGDDHAQIINSVDFFPVYYVDNPSVKRQRTFSYGVGIDLGFHIRIRQRLHLGMIGKLQLFQPFDKDEPQTFPRYGFVGTGVLLRYD